MENKIWIIKSVSELNGIKNVSNVYAVTSEEAAKQDVVKCNENAKEKWKDVPEFKTWYYYEEIKVFG